MKIDTRKLAEIDAAVWYSVEEVAALFDRSPVTVRRWCRTGVLGGKPDPFDRRRVLVLGSTLLAKAGDLILRSAPAPSETDRQREARARRRLAEIRSW